MTEEMKFGNNRIFCRAILQMVGAPKEHIEETLKKYVEELKKDNDMQIVNSDFREAEKDEGENPFYSAFCEIEVYMKDIQKVMAFCFVSMPSHIEIIEPADLSFDSAIMSNFLNELQSKVHEIDMTVKNLRAQNQLLTDKSNAIIKNMVLISLKSSDKEVSEISKYTGVSENGIQNLLNSLVESKQVEKLDNNKYKLL